MERRVSVVVPIMNEEEILEERVQFLVQNLGKDFVDFEILLTENGSQDRTKDIARRLDVDYANVRGIVDDGPGDYGQALIDGINASANERVIIMELDYLDMDFFRRAFDMLSQCDLVIGSKKISPGIDQRSVKRRLLTWIYNQLLVTVFRIPVSETHGLKALNRSKLERLVNRCITSHSVYPSELVIRACRDMTLRVCEIPLSLPLREIRATRISASRRLRKTIHDLVLLRRALGSKANQRRLPAFAQDYQR